MARSRDAPALDFVHVLVYIWKAAWSFYDEGLPMPSAGSGAASDAALARRVVTREELLEHAK